MLLRVRGEKPQGPTDELHQQALYSSLGPGTLGSLTKLQHLAADGHNIRGWVVAALVATPE